MSNIVKDNAFLLGKDGRGILAADESTGTIGKRFANINLNNTEENRQAYRNILFTTKDLGQYISGVILFDETFYQKALGDNGQMIDLIKKLGSLSGIKVDKGAKSLPLFSGETITEGLDGLSDRLKNYAENGAKFAKWRGVIDIQSDNNIPSYYALRSNAEALARYAALCQEYDIVPIVEPEVLMDGDHSIDTCYEVTENTLKIVFSALHDARVSLEGIVLKPNMVISGIKNSNRASADQVSEYTVRCLKNCVPSSVPTIAFLSGGQGDVEATKHLNLINQQENLPWNVTYSYGRALQAAAIQAWNGKTENIQKAQSVLLKRAKMNSLAAKGEWSLALEDQ